MLPRESFSRMIFRKIGSSIPSSRGIVNRMSTCLRELTADISMVTWQPSAEAVARPYPVMLFIVLLSLLLRIVRVGFLWEFRRREKAYGGARLLE